MPGDLVVSVNFVEPLSANACFEATPSFWFKSDIVELFARAEGESGKQFV
ncbi:MAG: hypothetical protein QMC04_00550 [Ilumatobacter sp.]|jgi:hypothetical protein|tara:strand:+ start:421 stop:570 length:150 start_codon:yes stop_codon:yes gene_type:complete